MRHRQFLAAVLATICGMGSLAQAAPPLKCTTVTQTTVSRNNTTVTTTTQCPTIRRSFVFISAFPVYYTYPACNYYPANFGYASYGAYEPSYDMSSTYGGSAYESNDYERGRDWGQDLRRDIVTWEQFVAYLRDFRARSTTAAREDFHRGFVAGYGARGKEAFDKALKDAQAAESHASEPSPHADY